MKYLCLIIIMSVGLNADSAFGIIPDVKITNIQKYIMGKRLFHDTNLSKDKKISCSSCHDLDRYGTDNKISFQGTENIVGKLNSPTIFNTKFNIAQDGAGRASTIKDRTKISFLAQDEMGGNVRKLIQYIYSDPILYDDFIDIYGDVTGDKIFDSIAYFVENLLTPNSKFDKFLKGDKSVLNNSEMEGYHLFKKYGCSSCHNGLNIGGNMYQKLGVFSDFEDNDDNSLGRYTVTGKEYDKNVFKVPSLRNIAKTAPYLHDGSIPNLKKTIYEMGKLQVGIEISDKDILKIESFLKTLTGEITNEY